MDKSEVIILEENMDEKELPEIKNYKRIKYLVSIITSTLIISCIITLSIGNFKILAIEEKTKPMARNLVSDISVSKTYNLGSFEIYDQIMSIKYKVSIANNKFINKIVIYSLLGAFEFGNTGMSFPGKGTKSYMTKIFKFKFTGYPYETVNGYADGTLSWDVSKNSKGQYTFGLSGTLNLSAETGEPGKVSLVHCRGEGALAEAKGKLIIVSNESIIKDSDFSLGMGNLKVIFRGSNAIINNYTIKIFEGWRYI